MKKYLSLNKDLEEIIKVRTNSQFTSPYATIKLTRREKLKSSKTLRPDGIAEVQKIIAVPYFFRCFNKTQVHPFIKNNITHRGEHIFYVSTIARNLSYLLGLNEYLTEAIALAHDIGHPPFSHMGEKYLNEILQKNFNMSFYHNIQSSRVLNDIFFALNFSFQTIEGALRHNSPLTENTLKTAPTPKNCFDEISEDITNAFFNDTMPKRKMPTTLEAIVVRLSDIIAYIGKDRQDSKHITKSEQLYNQTFLGESNNEIINNIIIDILENSYDQPFIKLSAKNLEELKEMKKENWDKIYEASSEKLVKEKIKDKMEKLFSIFFDDLKKENKQSPIFTSHINYLYFLQKDEIKKTWLENYYLNNKNDKNLALIVTDFIASMTEDLFLKLANDYGFNLSENQFVLNYPDFD